MFIGKKTSLGLGMKLGVSMVLASSEVDGVCGLKRSQFFMITRQDKEEIVSNLTEAFKERGGMLIVDYTGIDSVGMVDLRRRIRNAGAKLRVVRKTLLKRALSSAKISEPDDAVFEGQTGLVYAFDDPVAVAKAVVEFRKDRLKESGADDILFTLRGGILDGKVLAANDAQALASIPSRNELLQRAVGSIASPLRGLVNVLSGPQRGFVIALNAIKESKA